MHLEESADKQERTAFRCYFFLITSWNIGPICKLRGHPQGERVRETATWINGVFYPPLIPLSIAQSSSNCISWNTKRKIFFSIRDACSQTSNNYAQHSWNIWGLLTLLLITNFAPVANWTLFGRNYNRFFHCLLVSNTVSKHVASTKIYVLQKNSSKSREKTARSWECILSIRIEWYSIGGLSYS